MEQLKERLQGRAPTPQELAEAMGISVETAGAMLKAAQAEAAAAAPAAAKAAQAKPKAKRRSKKQDAGMSAEQPPAAPASAAADPSGAAAVDPAAAASQPAAPKPEPVGDGAADAKKQGATDCKPPPLKARSRRHSRLRLQSWSCRLHPRGGRLPRRARACSQRLLLQTLQLAITGCLHEGLAQQRSRAQRG